jgi:phosphate transport system substrate-binding protein
MHTAILKHHAAALLAGLIAATAHAAAPLPPPYTAPAQPVTGVIRISGHGAYDNKNQDFIETLTKTWEAGFRRYHPDVRFDTQLVGTAAAIGSLYAGVGDLALMGREIWPNEISGFTEVLGYRPTGVDVVTGSFDVRNHGYALVVFVHKDNPLAGLTLPQLEMAFGADSRPGARHARTWGDLGATGAWNDQPIHLYGLPIARGFAQFFEDAVFSGRRKWNPALREFADQPGSKGGATDGGQAMVDAMAHDPLALGYAGLLYRNEQVRPVALAVRAGAPYVLPSKDSVTDHSYPLTRKITMFLNRAPGRPVDPKLKEFLRYVLSREGQEAVIREGGGYLPIIAPFAADELKKLD